MNHKIEVPKIIDENLRNYIQHLLFVSEYSDPEASVTIQRSQDKYIITITPDNKDFRDDIINNVLYFNQRLKIPITYSSSLKIQNKVSYTVEI